MEIVDLDISEPYYLALARRAKVEQVPLQVITERILQDAIELPEPPYRYAMLLCSRCGTTKHRHSRTQAVPRTGTFRFFFGCLACFRIRPHATAQLRDYARLRLITVEEAPTAARPAALASPARRPRPAVAAALWEREMVPGAPEAMQ